MEELLVSKEFKLVETLGDIKVYRRVGEEFEIEVYLLGDGTALLRAQMYDRFDETTYRCVHKCAETLVEHINDLLMEDDDYEDEDEY